MSFAHYAQDFANYVDFDVDQVYYLFTVTFCYPLAALHRALPRTWLRHASAILGGLWVLYMILGSIQMWHPVISTVIGYLMMATVPRRMVHKFIFVFSFLYLSIGHIWRMKVDYLGWSVDFTAPQMMVTIKLTQLAWNYRDGLDNDEKLRARQLRYRLKELPSLTEMLSYVLFFPCVYGGPTCEYGDYIDYTSRSGLWDPKHQDAAYYKWSTALLAALQRYLATIAVGAIYVLCMTYFSVDYMKTPEYTQRAFHIKYLYIMFAIAGMRHKYYLAWFVAEGAVMLSGLSYNGVDKTGKTKMDGVLSCNYFDVEYARNFKMAIDNWNMQTQKWLKYYVYVRVRVSKPLASMATWLTSALWHGFYPGYFITFFMGAVATIAAQGVRRVVRPMFMDVSVDPAVPKHSSTVMLLYNIVSIAVSTPLSLNYFAMSFITLEVAPAYAVWKSTYFLSFIIVIAWAVYELAVPHRKPKTKKVE